MHFSSSLGLDGEIGLVISAADQRIDQGKASDWRPAAAKRRGPFKNRSLGTSSAATRCGSEMIVGSPCATIAAQDPTAIMIGR